MPTNDTIAELVARIDKTKVLLDRITSQYDAFVRDDLPVLGRKNVSAMVVAELMVDYYTCLETCFCGIISKWSMTGIRSSIYKRCLVVYA